MKALLLIIIALLCLNKARAQAFLNKKTSNIEIYYVNPSDEYFSGTKAYEVMSIGKENIYSNTSLNERSHYCRLKRKHEIDSIKSLFKSLNVCRQLEMDDGIENNVRIILKIKYGFFRRTAYV